jgi:hypothetical protein
MSRNLRENEDAWVFFTLFCVDWVGSGIGCFIEATSIILFILPDRTLQLSTFLNKVIIRQSNKMPMKKCTTKSHHLVGNYC